MKRILLILVKVGISAALVAFFLHRLEWSELRSAFASADPKLLAAAAGCFLLSNVLGAFQWRELLRAQAIELPVRKLISLYFIGVFFNNFLVSNIGGDAVRVYDLKRLTGKGAAGFAATFADRFLGLSVLIAFSAVAYAGSPSLWGAALVAPIGVLAAALAGVLCFGFSRRLSAAVLGAGSRVLPASVASLLENIRSAFILYRQAYGLMARAVLLAVGVQVGRVGVYYIVGRAMGLEIPFATHVVFIPLIAVVAALPISFGGIGVRENLGAVLYGRTGVDPAAALAMMFLGYLCGIAASLVGGVQFVVNRSRPTESAAASSTIPSSGSPSSAVSSNDDGEEEAPS